MINRDAASRRAKGLIMVKLSFLAALVIAFLMFRATVVPPGGTQDIYIAQTAAGGDTGADCADALAYTFFNSSSNWASSFTAGKISPGTTVHYCGTITGTNTSNVNIFTTQGNGTSGSPITILFESGAIVQSPACPGGPGGSNACILVPNNYITVNGGTNGTVQAMLNGDSGATNCLGGTCTIQLANTMGVAVTGTNDIVENLTVTHMCMHTFQDNDSGFFQGSCNGIYAAGNPVLVTNNTIDNASTGIGGGNSNQEISYNTLTYCNRCIVVGSTTGVFTGLKIHNNDISQLYTWDDGAGNNYHHDGIMLEITSSGGQFVAPQIYDNYMHGLWSNDNIYGDSHVTEAIFLDTNGEPDSVPNAYIVRNVSEFDSSPCVVSGSGTCPHGVGKQLDYPTGGHVNLGGCNVTPCSPPNLSLLANNTMIGATQSGSCFTISDTSNNITVANNLCAGTSGSLVTWSSSIPYPGSGSGSVNYDLYPGVPTSNAFAIPTSTCYPALCGNPFAIINSWSQWKGTPYFFDVDCTPTGNTPGAGNSCNPSLASVALTPSYGLGAGSLAIGAAVNLTSAWCTTIPALCQGAPSSFGRGSTNNGVALPSGTTAWDTGAYPVSGTVTLTPTSYAFATTSVGSTSSDSPVTLTLTNNTGVTITSISISLTGSNPGDFSNTTTCGSSLTNSASCTISLTFAPTAVGARTATVSVSDSASSSPQTSVLSGTAIPSVINPSPANPVTFGVVVTDPSIPSSVKNEKHSKNLSAYNFDRVALVGFLHQDRVRNTAGASACQ
jgi:hypothetical protein